MKRRSNQLLTCALVLLVGLTYYLLAFNRERRRTRVPVFTFRLPEPVIPSHKGRTPYPERRAVCLGFAPDKPLGLVVADNYGRLFSMDMEAKNWQQVTKSTAYGHGAHVPLGSNYGVFAWDKQGRFIYDNQNQPFTRCDLKTGANTSFKVSIVPREGFVKLSPHANYAIAVTQMNSYWQGPWKADTIKLLDVARDRILWHEQATRDSKGNFPFVVSAAFSPDEQLVAEVIGYYGAGHVSSDNKSEYEVTTRVASRDITQLGLRRYIVQLRRVDNGNVVRTIEIPGFAMAGEVVSPNSLDGCTEGGAPVVFSPDGNLLAVAGVREVLLYNAKNGAYITAFGSARGAGRLGYRPVTFSRDGRFLAMAFGNAVEIWNIKNRGCVKILHTPAERIAFSYDGKWLATDTQFSVIPTERGQIQLWDISALVD